MAQIDKITDIYKELAQIPILKSAKILSWEDESKFYRIQSCWSQQNLERFKKVKFYKEYFVESKEKIFEGSPVDASSEILRTWSNDGKLSVILREVPSDGKTKQFIELWDSQQLLKTYDLSSYDVHGDVYFDPMFSTFELSPGNSKLLYIAEKKLPKSEPFYKPKNNPTTSDSQKDEKISKGTEYVFKPDWGEQLVGKHQSVLAILNFSNDSIEIVDGIPDEYFPSQAIWTPNGLDIVGVVYKLKPRYLGVVFCTNRESYIFHLKNSQFTLLTEKGLSCRSPRFRPDSEQLVWLERASDLPHDNAQRLMGRKWNKDIEIPWQEELPETIIPLVENSILILREKQKPFYGLFTQNLPQRCFTSDSHYLLFSSVQRSSIKSYACEIEHGRIYEIEIPDDSSLTILDVYRNYFVALKTSLIEPPQLMFGSITNSTISYMLEQKQFNILFDISLIICSKSLKTKSLDTLEYDITECQSTSSNSDLKFNYSFLRKKDAPIGSMPLIAVPHGGPHVSFSNAFYLAHAVFAALGFGVLRINYLGSTGMGTKSLETLLGRVGELDVNDCFDAVKSALNKYPSLNSENLTLCGGSHGGFLVAHLSGQFPNEFKAVVMRNPAIELPTLFNISDIPDWCVAETGTSDIGTLPENTPPANYVELIKKMYEHSPTVHVDKVKAPTLIALGSKDLRVPASQGKLWYYRLKENGVKSKILMYDDNHSLMTDKVQIDFTINTALWMMEHTDYEKLQDRFDKKDD